LPSHPNVLAATGHGHLGLSMAAVTARIIGELVTHGRSTLDVAALRPGRFST
jgi:D-amino-acid dehydrogenase